MHVSLCFDQFAAFDFQCLTLCFSRLAGSFVGHAAPRLWQRYNRGAAYGPASSTSIGTECCCKTDTSIAVTHKLEVLHSPERIDFKLVVLSYWCLPGVAPQYLSNHIPRVAISNRLRLQPSSSSRLVIRRSRFATVGDRAFPVASSRLWNSLPDAPTLGVFRKCLKTHLLCRFYNID